MDEKGIKTLAKEYGFEAECMDVDKVIFEHSFRKYCEENLCGKYNANYGCPPDCGTPQEMEQRVRKHARALVLQSKKDVEDAMDEKVIKPFKVDHNNRSKAFFNELKKEGMDGIISLAGPCTWCSPCKKEMGQPCAFPDKVTSCISAYCINIAEVAKECNMECWCGNKKVIFFSIIFTGK